MNEIIALILAGGRVDELLTLTEHRPKAAVPIFGSYRFIDFILSNMMHSRIDIVGILSQYRPSSLMRHIGTGEHWDFIGRRRTIRILPPYTGLKASDWYRGTADAVYQNIAFINEFKPKYVLIAAADHIYQMNYRDLYKFHIQKNADVTVCFTKVKIKQPWFGYGIIAKDGRLVEYQEKPSKPISNWVSMTVYLFRTELLLDMLKENASAQSHEFGKDIIPKLPARCGVYGYKFNDYWAYSRTIEMYYQTNMELINRKIDLHKWQVRTNLVEGNAYRETLPARLDGSIVNSWISDGCIIKGRVRNSILSPGVVIELGAEVEDSIIFHNTIIKQNARLKKVICDKDCVINEGVKIGFCGEKIPSEEFPDLIFSGITILGKNTKVKKGTNIGANTVIYSSSVIEGEIKPGSTIK